MKRLAPAIVLFISFSQIFGQTTINSDININTTWTKASSPYLVVSTITVAENISLTIEPGVVVKSHTSLNLMHVDGCIFYLDPSYYLYIHYLLPFHHLFLESLDDFIFYCKTLY